MVFLAELKRRNVFRVATAYAALSWLLIRVAETTFPAVDLAAASVRVVIMVLAIGLVPVLIFAWAFEVTPEGLKREKDVAPGTSITFRTAKQLDIGSASPWGTSAAWRTRWPSSAAAWRPSRRSRCSTGARTTRATAVRPGSQRFIRESGSLDYWREHGFPPQCRRLGTGGFECG